MQVQVCDVIQQVELLQASIHCFFVGRMCNGAAQEGWTSWISKGESTMPLWFHGRPPCPSPSLRLSTFLPILPGWSKHILIKYRPLMEVDGNGWDRKVESSSAQREARPGQARATTASDLYLGTYFFTGRQAPEVLRDAIMCVRKQWLVNMGLLSHISPIQTLSFF